MSRFVYRLIIVLIVVSSAIAPVAPVFAQGGENVFLPLAGNGYKDYPDPPDQEEVSAAVETLEVITYKGFELRLTNVEYVEDDDEFKILNKIIGGTVEILSRPQDGQINCFVPIDWDTVISDKALWTVGTFTNADGSPWSLTTTMENNKKVRICNGDESSEMLKITDAVGRAIPADFSRTGSFHIQPGTHRTGDRRDSTLFGLEVGKIPTKVSLCHRTNSTSNPYVLITVDEAAADGIAGNSGQQPDHFGEHNGPIWQPGMPNGGDWGDIIPPILPYHNGLNWTTQGQEFFDNGCNKPEPTPTFSPTPIPSATPTVTPTVTVTPTPAPTNTPTVTITPTVTPIVVVTPTATPTPSVTVTPKVTPTVTITPTVIPTPITEEMYCESATVEYDFSADKLTGTTTGKGSGWRLYDSKLSMLVESYDTNTFNVSSIDFGGYQLRWFNSLGLESSQICNFKPHRLSIPQVRNQFPAVCSAMTTTIRDGGQLAPGTDVTFQVSTRNVSKVHFSDVEAAPDEDGVATLTMAVQPGTVYRPELLSLQGDWEPAGDACEVQFIPFPTKVVRVCTVWDDPEYICRDQEPNQEPLIEYDWSTGTFVSHVSDEDKRTYRLNLIGEPVNGELHAFSKAWGNEDEAAILRFQKLFDTRGNASYVFHNEFSWTFGNQSIAVKGLGSYWHGLPYGDPIATIVGEKYLLWDEQLVGTRVDLGSQAIVVPGRFWDTRRNKGTPALGILAHGCIATVSVPERVPDSAAPSSALFQIAVYEGCEGYLDSLNDGFLLPILLGEKKVADPNLFPEPSLVPGVETSALNDVQIVFVPIETQ